MIVLNDRITARRGTRSLASSMLPRTRMVVPRHGVKRGTRSPALTWSGELRQLSENRANFDAFARGK